MIGTDYPAMAAAMADVIFARDYPRDYFRFFVKGEGHDGK
jgi:hypothetical protein